MADPTPDARPLARLAGLGLRLPHAPAAVHAQAPLDDVGVAWLPLDSPVEVELEVEVRA